MENSPSIHPCGIINNEKEELEKKIKDIEGRIAIYIWLLEENFKDREFDENIEDTEFRDEITDFYDRKIECLLIFKGKIEDVLIEKYGKR